MAYDFDYLFDEEPEEDPFAYLFEDGPNDAKASDVDPFAYLFEDGPEPLQAEEPLFALKTGITEPAKVEPEKDENSLVSSGLATVDALGSAVLNLPAKAIMAVQGQKGASVADRGLGDKYIKWVEDRNKKLAETHSKTGDLIPGLLTNKDVAEAGSNLAFGGVSMAGSLGAGAAGTAVGGPVGMVAGGVVGGAATAYQMDGYMAMQSWLEKRNQENITKGLGPMTKKQEDEFKEEFSDLATKHALWEAGPEGVGNTLEIALLAAKKIPGVRWMPKKLVGKAVKGVLRGLGVLGVEATTETQTQIGQTNVEIEAGMSDEPPREFTSADDQIKSLKEVLPQVLLLTGGMSAGGMAYRGMKAPDADAGLTIDDDPVIAAAQESARAKKAQADVETTESNAKLEAIQKKTDEFKESVIANKEQKKVAEEKVVSDQEEADAKAIEDAKAEKEGVDPIVDSIQSEMRKQIKMGDYTVKAKIKERDEETGETTEVEEEQDAFEAISKVEERQTAFSKIINCLG